MTIGTKAVIQSSSKSTSKTDALRNAREATAATATAEPTNGTGKVARKKHAGPASRVAVLCKRAGTRFSTHVKRTAMWTSSDKTVQGQISEAQTALVAVFDALRIAAEKFEAVPADYRPSKRGKGEKATTAELEVGAVVSIRSKKQPDYADCYDAATLAGDFVVSKLGAKRIGIAPVAGGEMGWVPRGHLSVKA